MDTDRSYSFAMMQTPVAARPSMNLGMTIRFASLGADAVTVINVPRSVPVAVGDMLSVAPVNSHP